MATVYGQTLAANEAQAGHEAGHWVGEDTWHGLGAELELVMELGKARG